MSRSAVSGSSTTWRAIVVVPTTALVLLSSIASFLPSTVIASPTPATFRSTLSVISLAATSRRSLFSTDWKPLSSVLTLYVPGSSAGTR